MAINKLKALNKGNALNSSGKDVANSVNALIDGVESLEQFKDNLAADQITTDSGNTVQEALDAGVVITISESAPTTPKEGDEWINCDTLDNYQWYVDADGGQWVSIGKASQGKLQEVQAANVKFASGESLEAFKEELSADQVENVNGGSVQDYIDSSTITIERLESLSANSLQEMLDLTNLKVGDKISIKGYSEPADGGYSDFEVVDPSGEIGIVGNSGTFKLKRLSGHSYVDTLLKGDGELKVAAHRGWHGTSPGVVPGLLTSEVYFVPENTSEAINFSKNLGAWGVESDTKVTSDNKLVVFHDNTVDRTTNETGNVSSFTEAQLLAMDAGSYVSPRYEDARIMTFDNWLKVCKRNGVTPVAEVSVFGLSDELSQSVIDSVERYYGKYPQNIIVMSTQLSVLQKLRERSAVLPLGFLPSYGQSPSTGQIEEIYKIGNCMMTLTGNVLTTNPSVVDGLNARGIPFSYAIANNDTYFNRAADAGCSLIITDFIRRG